MIYLNASLSWVRKLQLQQDPFHPSDSIPGSSCLRGISPWGLKHSIFKIGVTVSYLPYPPPKLMLHPAFLIRAHWKPQNPTWFSPLPYISPSKQSKKFCWFWSPEISYLSPPLVYALHRSILASQFSCRW